MPPTTNGADVPGCTLCPVRQRFALPLHNTSFLSTISSTTPSAGHEPPMYPLDLPFPYYPRFQEGICSAQAWTLSNTRACPTSTLWFPHPAVLTQPWTAFSKYPDGPVRRVWPPVRANLTHAKELKDKI